MESDVRTLASIPLALFYPGVLAAAAAAGYVGGMVGRSLPGEQRVVLEHSNAFTAQTMHPMHMHAAPAASYSSGCTHISSSSSSRAQHQGEMHTSAGGLCVSGMAGSSSCH
jgi:hypothetical protein